MPDSEIEVARHCEGVAYAEEEGEREGDTDAGPCMEDERAFCGIVSRRSLAGGGGRFGHEEPFGVPVGKRRRAPDLYIIIYNIIS